MVPPPSPYKLPWAGIFGGVLLVIAVLATMRVISKISDNINNGTATAIAQTATAQASLTITPTPDIIATAEQLLTLTAQAASLNTPAPEVTSSP